MLNKKILTNLGGEAFEPTYGQNDPPFLSSPLLIPSSFYSLPRQTHPWVVPLRM
jgi:hypothetical protein